MEIAQLQYCIDSFPYWFSYWRQGCMMIHRSYRMLTVHWSLDPCLPGALDPWPDHTGSTVRGAIALKMGDSGVQSIPRRRSLIPRGMAPSLLLLLVGCPCLMVLHEMTPYRIEERAGSWTANLMQISTLLRSECGIRDSKASRYQVGGQIHNVQKLGTVLDCLEYLKFGLICRCENASSSKC